MDEKHLVKVSRYLSKHLRHRPERLGLRLEPGGWVGVEELLEACALNRFPIRREELREVVERNDKRRFAFDPSGTRIRAQQGHSVPVDLGLDPLAPPPMLYHGTNESVISGILHEGLSPMGRHHVHLSPDPETARKVGRRCGRPVVLEVDSGRMAREGHAFYRSGNGVWLVDAIPPRYLRRL